MKSLPPQQCFSAAEYTVRLPIPTPSEKNHSYGPVTYIQMLINQESCHRVHKAETDGQLLKYAADCRDIIDPVLIEDYHKPNTIVTHLHPFVNHVDLHTANPLPVISNVRSCRATLYKAPSHGRIASPCREFISSSICKAEVKQEEVEIQETEDIDGSYVPLLATKSEVIIPSLNAKSEGLTRSSSVDSFYSAASTLYSEHEEETADSPRDNPSPQACLSQDSTNLGATKSSVKAETPVDVTIEVDNKDSEGKP